MNDHLTEVSRKLMNLLLLCQESAERGEMGTEVIADGLDLAGDLLNELLAAVKEGATV